MDRKEHDFDDPDPWLALELDKSTFIDEETRGALMANNRSRSRQFLFPVIRPLARLSIILMQLIRIVLPNSFTSSKLLHVIIVWGMKNFVKPEANYLILRHFNIGTQILQFIAANIDGLEVRSHPLKPKKIEDLRDNVFVQHDLNIYNFIIEVGQHLKDQQTDIAQRPIEDMDFSAIVPPDEGYEELKDRWTNVIDLQTAIELYTPVFAMLLSDSAFWRASNSLQLDETVAVYVAKLFGEYSAIAMVNNRHPMVPLSTMQAGFRLMLHGLDAENLYGFIVHCNNRQLAGKGFAMSGADVQGASQQTDQHTGQ
ncbi:MAG: hypothetical protein Alpg2KO_10960 [Alphaproteobacteria bacterium]